jgi:uncharacterized protein (DUF488 family)
MLQAKLTEIWTIGHSTRSIEEFIDLLQANQIQTLVDVRRFPGSRRHPQFGQAQLSEALARVGIEYFHFPELGGRRTAQPDSPNTAWRNEAFRGYADYMSTAAFPQAIGRLTGLAETRRTVIMCAEALWWQCHRSLIADYLKASDHTVWHIMSANRVQLHSFSGAARLVNGRLSYREADPEPELPLR